MMLLSQLIDEYEQALFKTHGNELLPSHLKALADMKRCRNSGSLLMLAECDQCHHQAFLPHSCGHRNCPHCQHFGRSRPSMVFSAFRLLSITVNDG